MSSVYRYRSSYGYGTRSGGNASRVSYASSQYGVQRLRNLYRRKTRGVRALGRTLTPSGEMILDVLVIALIAVMSIETVYWALPRSAAYWIDTVIFLVAVLIFMLRHLKVAIVLVLGVLAYCLWSVSSNPPIISPSATGQVQTARTV
jgi:hypothetical protein